MRVLSIILTYPINFLLQFFQFAALVESQHTQELFRREIDLFETGRVRGIFLCHRLKVRVLLRSPDRIHPEPHTIAVEQFLEMLRFENRSKLAELPDELVKG